MLVPSLMKRLENRLKTLTPPEKEGDVPRHMAATFLVNGLIALLTDWLISGSTLSPEAMDEIYQTLARPTFDRLLEM